MRRRAGGPDRGRWWPAPVFGLLLVAPWAAECSWGGFPAEQFPVVVVFLGPLYGGAAVLIREVARRTGGGWPVMALLAAAFGVVQAGLVDQSLFDRHFLDDTQFAEEGRAAVATLVPGIGVSAGQAVDYIGNHVLLSICAPIALVEALVPPARRDRPWLGRRGLVGVAILYVGRADLRAHVADLGRRRRRDGRADHRRARGLGLPAGPPGGRHDPRAVDPTSAPDGTGSGRPVVRRAGAQQERPPRPAGNAQAGGGGVDRPRKLTQPPDPW